VCGGGDGGLCFECRTVAPHRLGLRPKAGATPQDGFSVITPANPWRPPAGLAVFTQHFLRLMFRFYKQRERKRHEKDLRMSILSV